jgi:hypothetical protein
MSLRENIKDKKLKFEYKLEEAIFDVLVVVMFTVGIYIVAGFSFKEIMVWNFFKVLTFADVYLNAFFHRLFDSITTFFLAIKASDSIKDYFILVKDSIYQIWHLPTFYFVPKEYLTNMTFQEFKANSAKYFYLLIITVIVWGYVFFYFFKNFRMLPKSIRKIIYSPVNYLIFNNLSDSKIEKVGALFGGFFENFENRFLKRTVKIEDGYERVKNLHYLKNIPQILIGDKNYKDEYNHIVQTFFSNEHFRDLFLIIEGYMTSKGKPFLFDKYIEKLDRKEYEKWKAYNGTDTVYFSNDAIKYFIDDETEKFDKIINNFLLRGKSYLSIFLNRYKKRLIKDKIRVTKMLFGINNKQNTIRYITQEQLNLYERMISTNDNDEWFNLFKKRLRTVLKAYFRFVLLREILGSYTNIPAGTIVVKIDDYTMRNIIENYDMKSLISIDKNKNDGSNSSFENDLLTNLFLVTFWYYNKKFEDKTIFEKIKQKWNLDVTEIYEEIEEDEEQEKMFEKMRDELKILKGTK